MAHPLILRLTDTLGWPRLADAAAIGAFVDRPGAHCLFVPGDPATNLESADVAVILPELVQAFQGAFDAALVDDAVEAETRAAAGVYKTPLLVFFRDGRQVGAIPKVRDWDDYLVRIQHILARNPEEAPA